MYEYECIHVSKPDILIHYISNMHVADQSKLTIQDEMIM